ncbi:MAG TPA: LUD domain-containing protein [Anaerolineales bacterium]
MSTPIITTLEPNLAYAEIADNTQIERTFDALKAHGFNVFVAEDGAAARKIVAELLPAGVEVFTATSVTLTKTGISEDINESGRYNSVRARLATMDFKTQNREMNKLGATPEYVVGSVHALTENGSAIIASGTGSQLASYASAAARVIWVVGAQKIVRDLEEGMKRVEEYSLPLEDARAMQAYGRHSSVNKMLVVNREGAPGRITVVIVKENLGF